MSCSFGPPPSPYDDPLRPADELFYTVWGASRSDRNLARLIDLRARIDLLLMDLAEPSRVAASEPRRAALRALRLAALERRVASAAKRRSTTSDDVSPESLLERIRSLRSETSGPIQGAIEDKRRAEVALFDRIEAENQAALAGVYARLAGEDEERPKDR